MPQLQAAHDSTSVVLVDALGALRIDPRQLGVQGPVPLALGALLEGAAQLLVDRRALEDAVGQGAQVEARAAHEERALAAGAHLGLGGARIAQEALDVVSLGG